MPAKSVGEVTASASGKKLSLLVKGREVGALELSSPAKQLAVHEGALWVASWDGWCVRRYLSDGSLDTVVRLPVAQVTSCAFGGPDLRDLYITTAWTGLDETARAVQPAAGGLFRVRTSVAGLPPAMFAG